MGFSFWSWNSDLSRRISEIVKATCPAVNYGWRGHPSMMRTINSSNFSKCSPRSISLCRTRAKAGSLVHSIESGQARSGPIRGVAYIDEFSLLIRGKYERPVSHSFASRGEVGQGFSRAAALGDDRLGLCSPYEGLRIDPTDVQDEEIAIFRVSIHLTDGATHEIPIGTVANTWTFTNTTRPTLIAMYCGSDPPRPTRSFSAVSTDRRPYSWTGRRS